jgi:hypothetical protein
MSSRVAKWLGGILTIAAIAGVGVYIGVNGLDQADKLGSVIGALVGVAGLALAAYGTITDRARAADPPPAAEPPPAPVQNEIHGGTFHGPVLQGQHLDVTFDSSAGKEPPTGKPTLPTGD